MLYAVTICCALNSEKERSESRAGLSSVSHSITELHALDAACMQGDVNPGLWVGFIRKLHVEKREKKPTLTPLIDVR